MANQRTPNLRCVDLFSGCGGLSLGLKYAGWEGLFALEKDAMAFETFNKNFLQAGSPYKGFDEWPSWLPVTNHDIGELLSNSMTRRHLQDLRGTLDLVAGGPPCQGFSVGGRRDGSDERNSLVLKMLDFVSLTLPKAVLVENVEGITRKFLSRPGAEMKGSMAEEVVSNLTKLGYSTIFRVLTASDFGVPQTRRRVVIFGYRDSAMSPDSLQETFDQAIQASMLEVKRTWGLPESRQATAKDALDDLCGGEKVACPDSSKFESSKYLSASSSYARAMRKGARKGTIPNSHRYSKHGDRISNLYRTAHETQPPGRLSKAFLLSMGTKKDKKVLIDPNHPVSTITTHPDEFIHYAEPRNITVREMARLQSFPDDFSFHGRYTINGARRKFDVARCSQVGNAVPPLLSHGIGIAIKQIIVCNTQNPSKLKFA